MSDKQGAPEVDTKEYVESWLETLEILNAPETTAALRQGIRDVKAGRVIPWEDAKKELGL